MDTQGQRLRRARLKAGFKSAALAHRRFATKFANDISTYRSHENGWRDFHEDQAQAYAEAYGVSASWLLCLPEAEDDGGNSEVGEIVVKGEAQAGVWRDPAVDKPQHMPGKKLSIPKKAAKRPEEKKRFGVRVADASVDKVFAKGGYVVCVHLDEDEQGPEHFRIGDVLYIERTRHNLKEMSLRRVTAIEGGKLRLSTHSTEQQFKLPDVIHPSSGEKTVLLGKVVGHYSDYPN